MKRKTTILAILIGFTAAVSAQSATIDSLNPTSVETVTGEELTVDISYSTSSVDSCTLGWIDSSLPSNWEKATDINVQTTSGSSNTARSPTLSTLTEAEQAVRISLSCSSSGGSTAVSTSTVNVDANQPPFLEGSLQSPGNIDVKKGRSYTVEFTVRNTGGSSTSGAKALVTSPEGYSHPDSVSMREAGQDDGVITPSTGIGTVSFDFTADSPQDGTLRVDLTSSKISNTESFTISLDAPDGGNNKQDDEEDPSGGGGGFTLDQNESEDQTTDQDNNDTVQQKEEDEPEEISENETVSDTQPPAGLRKRLDNALESKSPGDEGYQKLKKAEQAYERGNYQKAESLLEEARTTDDGGEPAVDSLPLAKIFGGAAVIIAIILGVVLYGDNVLKLYREKKARRKLGSMTERLRKEVQDIDPSEKQRIMDQIQEAESLTEKGRYYDAIEVLDSLEEDIS